MLNMLWIITRSKYLVPCDFTVGQFVFIVRKHMEPASHGQEHKLHHQAIYFLINDTVMPIHSQTFGDLYQQYKNPDTKMLHITYTTENTFGCNI